MVLKISSHMIQHTAMFSKFGSSELTQSLTLKPRYVNETVATTNGYTNNDSVTISVDTTNKWPNGGPGRPAVRIVSDNTYTHGLFILDLNHMPYGCGTWPAFWLLGPDWPGNGEIGMWICIMYCFSTNRV
jgi:beta-glucanase (GH16 family)